MSKKNNPRLPSNDSFTDFLHYTTPNGKVNVEIFLRNETVWLTQDKIAQLFGVQLTAITKHLKNIFETGELQEELVSSILEHTTQHGAIEGKTQSTKVNHSHPIAYAVRSQLNATIPGLGRMKELGGVRYE